MVNNTIVQPAVQNPIDKAFLSPSKGNDSKFKEIMDQTTGKKTEGKEEASDESEQKQPADASVLAQLLFVPDFLLSEAKLPKINELGMQVAEEVTAAAAAQTGRPEDAEGLLKQANAPAGENQAAEKELILEEPNKEPAKQETLNGLAKGLQTESEEAKAPSEATNSSAGQGDKVTSSADKQAEKQETTAIPAQTKKADTEDVKSTLKDTQVPAQTISSAELKQNSQISAKAEVKTPQTVYVNPQNTEEMIKDISDSMLKNITSGKQEFELQLEPQHLGKLAIKVTYEAGRTAVSIVCSSAKTLEAMAQNAKEIGSILDARLGTETAIVVDRAEVDYLDQYNEQNQKENQSQEQENGRQEAKGSEKENQEHMDFLQQLRLGLV